MKKFKVSLIVTGFPTVENPAHGIFNKRAAEQLANYVDLTVLQLRVWKPGRKFVEKVNSSAYEHYIIAAPHLPFGNDKFICSLIKIYFYIFKSTLKNLLEKQDLFHSVGASFSGALAGKLARHYHKKHILQIIGTDINSELPSLLGLSCFKNFNENIDAVGCNSNALKDEYVKLMGDSVNNLEVIYRGIDVNNFEYSFKLSDNRIKFLFLGGIPFYKHLESGRNLKGGITLMEAWKNIEGQLLALNCELCFAGPDSDSQVSLNWHNSLKHKDRVILKGMLTPQEVIQHYSKCNIVIIPSLEEGMPNAALEAGATGKCLIASNVGGLPELIINKYNGILIKPGSVKGLCDSLIFCAENRIVCENMGLNLRKTIKDKFDSRLYAEKYFEMYNHLVTN